MGCGGSKNVKIRTAATAESTVIQDGNTVTDTSSQGNGVNVFENDVDVNVFDNSVNVFDDNVNNNALGGSSHNAKPRLRSAIRRDTDIKPVTTDINDNININTNTEQQELESDNCGSVIITRPLSLDFTTDQTFVPELPFNRDSGFDSNRANSEAEASERAKSKSSLREETSSVAASSVVMRPDSVITGSVVTARDLNASFMTMSDDYMMQPNGDVSLDLDMPIEDQNNLQDFEDTHCRTLSNTPSRTFSNTPRTLSNTPLSARPHSSTPSRLVFSTEPLPVPLYPKNIDVIKEESEGGFTPRSLLEEVVTPRFKVDPLKREILPKYHCDEVLRHNQAVGWSAWGIYKSMVYDTNKVIGVFKDMHAEYGAKRIDREKEEKRDNSDDEDSCYEEDECFEDVLKSFDEVYPKKYLNPIGSLAFAIRILTGDDGIPLAIIEQHLPQCVIGEVKVGLSAKFWETFRKEVDKLVEDLTREYLRDELTENTKDILIQLQQWNLKYRDNNPQPQQPSRSGRDPNQMEFELPSGIRYTPDCLRRWLEVWELFDTDVPETGSWTVYEVDDIDLGDPQEIFEDSLRSHIDLENPFATSVNGEAAWEVLHPGIVADDVMTAEQMRTEESRRYRTDLHDPRSMERRRVKILNYFVKKYEMDSVKVNHFLQWSQAMEEGQKQFQILCENG